MPHVLTMQRSGAVVLQEHISGVREALSMMSMPAFEQVVDIVLEAYRENRRLYIVGNGGSASTASHFACDLAKATIVEGRPRMRVTSLNDNVALLTAWANDTSYERVFAEQLRNLIDPGDVLIALSASGNSPNVLAAVDAARSAGAVTVAFVGFDGGRLKDAVTAAVHVPVHDYGVVEDCHLVLEHAVTDFVRGAVRG